MFEIFIVCRQISAEASSKLIKVLSTFQGTIKSTITSADDGMILLSPTEEEENEESPLQMMLRLKGSMMR